MNSERQTVLHSWCVQAQWNPPTVVGGSGARLFLEDGRTVLDMSSLAECSNLGHQHPAIVAAVRAQAEKLCFVTNAWGATPRAELADRLLERSGFAGGRVFFTLGGADANEHAVKIARQAVRKPRGVIIARDRSYHGSTHLAMAMSGDARTRAQVDPDAFGVSHVAPPYAYRCPFGSGGPTECGERAAAAVGERIEHFGSRPRGGRDHGTECGLQRHRGAGQFLAGTQASDARARRAADRGRGHERIRSLRRVVRLAALWRRARAAT